MQDVELAKSMITVSRSTVVKFCNHMKFRIGFSPFTKSFKELSKKSIGYDGNNDDGDNNKASNVPYSSELHLLFNEPAYSKKVLQKMDVTNTTALESLENVKRAVLLKHNKLSQHARIATATSGYSPTSTSSSSSNNHSVPISTMNSAFLSNYLWLKYGMKPLETKDLKELATSIEQQHALSNKLINSRKAKVANIMREYDLGKITGNNNSNNKKKEEEEMEKELEQEKEMEKELEMLQKKVRLLAFLYLPPTSHLSPNHVPYHYFLPKTHLANLHNIRRSTKPNIKEYHKPPAPILVNNMKLIENNLTNSYRLVKLLKVAYGEEYEKLIAESYFVKRSTSTPATADSSSNDYQLSFKELETANWNSTIGAQETSDISNTLLHALQQTACNQADVWEIRCASPTKSAGTTTQFIGRSIPKLQKTLQEFINNLKHDNEHNDTSNSLKRFQIQKCVPKLLLDEKECTIRGYLLVSSLNPLHLFYHEGHVTLNEVGSTKQQKLPYSEFAKLYSDYWKQQVCGLDGTKLHWLVQVLEKDIHKLVGNVATAACLHTFNTLDKSVTGASKHHFSNYSKLAQKVLANNYQNSYSLLAVDMTLDEEGKPLLKGFEINPNLEAVTLKDTVVNVEQASKPSLYDGTVACEKIMLKQQEMLSGMVDVLLRAMQYRSARCSLPAASLLSDGSHWFPLSSSLLPPTTTTTTSSDPTSHNHDE